MTTRQSKRRQAKANSSSSSSSSSSSLSSSSSSVASRDSGTIDGCGNRSNSNITNENVNSNHTRRMLVDENKIVNKLSAMVESPPPPPSHQRYDRYYDLPNGNTEEKLVDDNEEDEMFVPLKHGCTDVWNWSKTHRSQEVLLSGLNLRTAFFHPNWSKGTAGVRGTKILNNGRYYWEINVTNRIFGTSMMFGIGTAKAKLHADSFINLLGEDGNSWALSHKGLIWHRNVCIRFTKCFKENQATIVGMLFDGIDGTLTYFKDGQKLGVAFTGLNKIQEPIYPIISSTAAKTEMILGETRRDFVNLQDRCRAVIVKYMTNQRSLRRLKLPKTITAYLAEAIIGLNPPKSTELTPYSKQPIDTSISPSNSSLTAVCSNFENMYAV